MNHHADKQAGKSDAEVRKAQERMIEINKAKEILLDEHRKMAYDMDDIAEDAEFEEWRMTQAVEKLPSLSSE